MQLRGEFVRGDGLVIPNSLTSHGIQVLLARALQGTVSPGLFMGLGGAVFTNQLQAEQLNEPSFANGYARQALGQNAIDWPTTGMLGGEAWIESKPVIFTATGTGFDIPIWRPFLTIHATNRTGNIFSLGAPLPAALSIESDTPEATRTFRYRIYAA